jgi:hypothetical protein
MAAGVKFESFIEAQFEGIHDWDAHTFKWALTNSAPNAATNTVLADITQIANGNGYTTGGTTITGVVTSRSGGTFKVVMDDTVFTASGGSMAAFRYAVLYNDTAVGDPLVGYYDYGSSLTLLVGETFTLDINATNGILQAS